MCVEDDTADEKAAWFGAGYKEGVRISHFKPRTKFRPFHIFICAVKNHK